MVARGLLIAEIQPLEDISDLFGLSWKGKLCGWHKDVCPNRSGCVKLQGGF